MDQRHQCLLWIAECLTVTTLCEQRSELMISTLARTMRLLAVRRRRGWVLVVDDDLPTVADVCGGRGDVGRSHLSWCGGCGDVLVYIVSVTVTFSSKRTREEATATLWLHNPTQPCREVAGWPLSVKSSAPRRRAPWPSSTRRHLADGPAVEAHALRCHG